MRGLAPGTSRVRARRGEERDTVRELPTAGAPEKPKEQSSCFSGVSVRWGCAGAFARRVSSRPQGTGGRISPPPGKTEARRWACTRNQPRACETRRRKRHGARIAHRRCARKAKGAKLQLFGRFCALGNVWPHVLHIHGSLARAFARPKGTEAKLFPARENRSSAWACPRNQPRACETGRRHKPGARIAHRRCARKAKGAKLQLFGRFCALGMRRGFCPAGFLPAAGNRR